MRTLGALLAGALTLALVAIGLQVLALPFVPFPEGLDPFDPEQAEALYAFLVALPWTAWLYAMLTEMLATFAGAWVAGRLAPRRAPTLGLVVAALALLGSGINWMRFEHPLWYIAGELVTLPLLGWLAGRLAHRPR